VTQSRDYRNSPRHFRTEGQRSTSVWLAMPRHEI